MKPPIPTNESMRLETLASYKILDTPPEPIFDEIIALAATICGTPIAMVSLVDDNRQWFKAKLGIDFSETSRMLSFCAHTICESDMLVVEDALDDSRFMNNPMVTGEAGVRFYAGIPLAATEGVALGAICVVDRVPRQLSKDQIQALRILARRVEDQLELGRQIQQLKSLEAERRSVFLLTVDLLCVSDLNCRIVEVNPAWTRCLGWSEQELTGKTFFDFVLPEDHEATLLVFAHLRSGNPVNYFENRYRCKDGSYRWLSWSCQPYVEAGQFFAIARDVTERKREEIALARSNRAWRLFSRCNEASIHAKSETDLVDTVCRILVDEGKFRVAWVGYAMNDKSKTIVPKAHAGPADMKLPEIPLSWSETDQDGMSLSGRIIRAGHPLSIPDLDLNADCRPWKSFERKHGLRGVVGFPLKDQQRIFGVLMLYQNETHILPDDELVLLRELSDNLAFSIVNLRLNEELCKTHDAVLAMSRGASNILSGAFCKKIVFCAVEALGAHAGFIARFNHGQASATTICAVMDGKLVENFEYSLEGTPCNYRLSDGICMVSEGFGFHYPKAGMMVKAGYEAYAAAQLYNASGQPIGLMFLLFQQPISQCNFISSTLLLFAARASDELERMKYEQQFMRAQRMDSIGTLAGGIAHDINNVLTPIMMSIDMLRMYVDDPDGINILDMVAESATRGADMVRQVVSFARGGEAKPKEMEIAPIIDDLLRIIRETFPKNILIESILQQGIWRINADPTQIHQVLLNLCVNARDAMPAGGQITLNVQNMLIDKYDLAMNPDIRPGPYVTIQTDDTGHGISEDIIEKIFDPFFTTKELGRGTGLGLSTTLTIIKSHGGFVRVWSVPGEGTRFRLYLPALTAPGWDSIEATDNQMQPRGKGETVLVVDDEPLVRQITMQTLEAHGYKVLLAKNGSEALTIYENHQQNIAVVLTDMMMPIMDGEATIRALRQLNPYVRIIGASGINTKVNVSRAAASGANQFLAKPYTVGTLLKTLRKVLIEPHDVSATGCSPAT